LRWFAVLALAAGLAGCSGSGSGSAPVGQGFCDPGQRPGASIGGTAEMGASDRGFVSDIDATISLFGRTGPPPCDPPERVSAY
jgi:hypothetical protein